jgi:hypothetical protein
VPEETIAGCEETGRFFDMLMGAFSNTDEPLVAVVEIILAVERQQPGLVEALLFHAQEHGEFESVIEDADVMVSYILNGTGD